MTPREFRNCLRALGWSQRQFAHMLGASTTLVGRWYRGIAPVPTALVPWLRSLADAHRVLPLPAWRVKPVLPFTPADMLVPEGEVAGMDGDVSEFSEHEDGDGSVLGAGEQGNSFTPP